MPDQGTADFSSHLRAQQEAAEKPLNPSLEKHSDVVTRFAEKYGLKVATEDGNYSLRKDLSGIPSEVVGIRDNGDGIIQIDVYVRGPEGFLSPALHEVFVPVKKAGDEAILIDRAAADETSAGTIVVDTRELSGEELNQLMQTSRLRQRESG